MGLAVTGYSHLTAVGFHDKDPELNEGEEGGPESFCYYENHTEAYAYDSFPLSFIGIPVLRQRDGIVFGGCYAHTEATTSYRFAAGSYGGYNRWRERLQAKYNPDRKESEPFFELIWFADNEGTISSLAAQNLLADFEAYGPDVELGTYGNSYGGPFDDFHKACKLAAEDGLIRFS